MNLLIEISEGKKMYLTHFFNQSIIFFWNGISTYSKFFTSGWLIFHSLILESTYNLKRSH